MGIDRWPVDFRYISRRLVRQLVDQDEATRSRWRFSGIPTPWGPIGLHKNRLDRDNDFALCREATEAVRELTGTIAQGWGPYIQSELDLTMGTLSVLSGWKKTLRVEIAAMKAEVIDPEAGRVFVALFGSASNYIGRKPLGDTLAEIPSDIDGLYGILDRTREPGDPEINHDYLDRDLGHSPSSRAEAAEELLNGSRFSGFRTDHFDVLIRSFCVDETIDPYDRVILGTPISVATPLPSALELSTEVESDDGPGHSSRNSLP
jgi:hypothetical protein